jgi:hypothetical protein
VALGFGLCLLAPVGAARAAERGIEFTVRPAHPDYGHPRRGAWLVHRADPGDVVRDVVVVENLGEVRLDLVVYPTDAATTAQGAFALQPREAPVEDVASWVSVRRDRLHLRPGRSARVPVRIRIPENAVPGDHPGGVVARLARPVGRGPVGTYLAVGTRLYLSVTGPRRPRLEILSTDVTVRGGRPIVRANFANTGNTVLDVTGSYQVGGWFGLEGSRRGFGPAMELVPGAEVSRTLRYPDALLGGWYTVSVRLTDGEGHTLVREHGVFIPPSPALLLALGAVVAFLVWSAWALARRRRARVPSAQPAV